MWGWRCVWGEGGGGGGGGGGSVRWKNVCGSWEEGLSNNVLFQSFG